MRNNSFFLTFLISIGICCNCSAQKADSIIERFYTTKFMLSYSKNDIPNEFKKHYHVVYNHKFTVADPDEKFLITDSGNPKLPRMHLIFLGKETGDSLHFVYYEVSIGGIELRNYCHISLYNHNRVKKEIVLQLPNNIKDYGLLKKAIKNHEYTIIYK